MIETLIVIGGVIGAAVIGLFVFSRDMRRWSNRIYGLMTLSFILLAVANWFTVGKLTDPYIVLLCIRLVTVATTMVLMCLFFLTQVLAVEAGTSHYSRALNKFILSFSLVTIALNLSPFVFTSVALAADGSVSPTVSWGVAVFALHSMSVALLITLHLFGELRHRSKRRRGQATAILVGLAPTLVLAPITSFVLPVMFEVTWTAILSPLYVVFLVVAVAYAMIRHGMFDIRLAAVRTAAYILTIATLAAIYIVLVYLFSSLVLRNQTAETAGLLSPIAIGSALIIALVFQPIKRTFDKVTDRLFYKDNYSISQFIARINKALNSTNDLRTLLERTSFEVLSTLKASHAFFFVSLPEDRYVTAGTHRRARPSPAEFAECDTYLSDNAVDMVLASQLGDNHPLRRLMVSHRIEFLMPLRKRGFIIGYLCLGEPRKLGYTNRDLHALSLLTDELTIAIQNALSVEEVRKLNDTLEQRIAAATKELRASNSQLQRLDEAKDEFISMASHQLRTPLTSIKGYISMLAEGDVGEVSKEQKRLLDEAFISSERMVRLIGDFLNVSRVQTGKFVIEKRSVDLAALIQREIDGLSQHAVSRGLKFVYKQPKNIPPLEIDENKIQQVIMNFCDNAIFYSKEKGKITITLEEGVGYVEFRVTDNGIGVPEAEQPRLFNKFFRATNARRARPDGTGVGLFLAKKVISEHGGSVIFESKEGKGSTFGFRLPVSKEIEERA